MPPAMTLTCTVTDGVGTITIDRPDKRNAMSAAMWRALPGLLDGLRADASVRVVVLTGAGDHFCAGADIADLSDIKEGELSVVAEHALAAFPKPTVAAIRGFCVGGGCQLAAACDLRLAAADARFGITPAKLGLIYPQAATARLIRLVGPAAAKYLLFSADLVGADHALRIGLVDEVVADGLDERVAEFARTLASRSLLTQEATKDIVDSIAEGDLDEDRYRRWISEAWRTGDPKEGVNAFLERRPARFSWTGPSWTS